MINNNKSMMWPNVWMVLTLLALASLVASCSAGNVGNSNKVEAAELDGSKTIRVVGIGEAFGEPDEAQVTVGVETFAPEVKEATGENEEVIAAILDSLEEAGIAAKDIQTSNYSLWTDQRYGENGPEGIAGYRVSNQVTVVIRDIEKVGDVLASVTEAGANSIYGVSFAVSDPAVLEAEAREKALEDARQRAESLAQLSGLTLGDIEAIDEAYNQSMGPFPMAGRGFGGGGGDAETSISPGQLSYQSQVQVVFSIAD